jgi:hypothetical protein
MLNNQDMGARFLLGRRAFFQDRGFFLKEIAAYQMTSSLFLSYSFIKFSSYFLSNYA